MKFKLIVLMAIQLMTFQACAPEAPQGDSQEDQTETAPQKAPEGLVLSETLSHSVQMEIHEDLSFLSAISFSPEDTSDFKKLIGISDTETRTLLNWLYERVHYVLSDKDRPLGIKEPQGDDVVARNVGITFYLAGKEEGKEVSFDFPGVGFVTIQSPLTGVIQVGKGFLKSRNGIPIGSVAGRVFRLKTLIHEAMHSNGNEKSHSLGFQHVECPKGHAYEGQFACDNNANGPYTVGARFVLSFERSCTECTLKTRMILKAIAADSLSRSISDKVWDHTPEGQR